MGDDHGRAHQGRQQQRAGHLDGDQVPAHEFVAQPGVGVRRRAEAGRHINSFTVDTAKLGGWPWPYVRAVVTDERGYKAWANPLYPREG